MMIWATAGPGHHHHSPRWTQQEYLLSQTNDDIWPSFTISSLIVTDISILFTWPAAVLIASESK